MAKAADNPNYKVIAENRRARFDYAIEEDLEVGIMLLGSEVKSLREGQANIAESYAIIDDGELWLVNSYVAPYVQAKTFPHEEKRRRKLLASKKELSRLWNATQRQGMTLVPLVLYFQPQGHREAEDRHREGQEDRRQAGNLGQARLEPAEAAAFEAERLASPPAPLRRWDLHATRCGLRAKPPSVASRETTSWPTPIPGRSSETIPKTLVSTDWLAAHLDDPDLRILDASYYLPDMGRDARAEYEAAHIPGARFFDIDEIADARSTLPHMAAPVGEVHEPHARHGRGRRTSGGGL